MKCTLGRAWAGGWKKSSRRKVINCSPGQAIVELDAAELKARRDLAAAQINSAIHDAEAQAAQLDFYAR